MSKVSPPAECRLKLLQLCIARKTSNECILKISVCLKNVRENMGDVVAEKASKEIVDFIEANPNVFESDLLKKAQEICDSVDFRKKKH